MTDTVDFNDMLRRLCKNDNGDETKAATDDEGRPMEYAVHEVCLAYDWAVLTRRRGLAQRLHQAIVASDFDDWILLSSELGQAVEEADRRLAMMGRKS